MNLPWKELVGKTIKSVDDKDAANVVRIKFTDGTDVTIDTDAIGFGLYRPILYPSSDYEPKKDFNFDAEFPPDNKGLTEYTEACKSKTQPFRSPIGR